MWVNKLIFLPSWGKKQRSFVDCFSYFSGTNLAAGWRVDEPDVQELFLWWRICSEKCCKINFAQGVTGSLVVRQRIFSEPLMHLGSLRLSLVALGSVLIEYADRALTGNQQDYNQLGHRSSKGLCCGQVSKQLLFCISELKVEMMNALLSWLQ